jgi:C1A family cysteine protease
LDSSDITFVRDSGPEGSVVGMVLATALEFQIAKTTKKHQRISARYIYYAAREAGGFDLKIDSGARIKDGITVLSSKGAVAEEVWPYQAGQYAEKPPTAVATAERFRITDARPLSTVDDLKQALKQNGPVVAGITLFEGMSRSEVSKTGVIPLPEKKEQIVGGHAIVIVGYDDETRRLKFVNSWGKKWGDHGFGYLPYDYAKKYMSDAWTFRLLT